MATNLSEEHLEQLNTMTKAKAFLGREFLTWLWYVIESEESLSIETSSGTQEVELWIDDKLVLESSSARAHENVLKGGDPSKAEEAAAALRSGKTVKELKLGMQIKGTGEFICSLNAAELTPKSLMLPEMATDDGEETVATPIAHRINLMNQFLDVFDGIFGLFLEDRVEDTWNDKHLEDIRTWVQNRHDQILH